MTEREFAVEVVRRLREAGHQALWAGGCVRDELLGLVPKDYDIATDATPQQVRRLFRRTVAVGAAFGVVEVLGPRPLKVQVATFRTAAYTADAIRAMSGQITVVSAERIADELRKLLVDPHRARGMNLMYDVGLVGPVLPELLPMKGLPQGLPAAPTGDLWDHVMSVLDHLG